MKSTKIPQKIKDTIVSVATIGFVVIGIPVGLVWANNASNSSNSDSGVTNNTVGEPECRTEAIPFESEEEDSYDLYVGDSEIGTSGEDGEREICELDGVDVSNEITIEPVTEITLVGALEEESYEYNDSGCSKNQYVSGYFRSNGTYVSGYWRNSPSDNCY